MKRVLAFLLTALAALCVGATVSLFIDAAQGKDSSSSIGGGCVTLFFALLAGFNAYRLFKPARPMPRKPSRDERERLALACAAKAGGKLTEAELSLESGLSLDEAKRVLGELAGKGVAEIEVSSGGTIVYAFPGLISGAEKGAAKPVEEA